MPTESNPPKVFISYSHDSQEHAARVLKLSDVLCKWGFDCHIDQYELAPASWLSWMERQIREADFVLIVCTEVYCRRFEGRETRPTGVGWEGGIITTQLYEQQKDKAARFIPVVFSQTDEQHVPLLLRPTHRHRINVEKLDAKNPQADLSAENLYRHLAGMPRVAKPKIGQLIKLPPINVRDDLDEGDELLLRRLTNQPLFEEPPVAPKVRELPPITRKIEPAKPKPESQPVPPPVIVQLPKQRIIHQNFTEELGNGVKLEMIAIPGGSFLMGSEDFDNAKPVHWVKLSPFHIGKFQVTQAQWKVVMGNNPSHFKGDALPVENVSRNDAVVFCQKLPKQTGQTYRLPTEAEWEYACLAGSTGKYCFGDDEALLKDYAWYDQNSDRKTHPVGEKKPGHRGLHDMHGNVWEWCRDLYSGDYYAELATQAEAINPQGPASGDHHVLRGGSWWDDLDLSRAVYRNFNRAVLRGFNIGFRVVMSRPPSS